MDHPEQRNSRDLEEPADRQHLASLVKAKKLAERTEVLDEFWGSAKDRPLLGYDPSAPLTQHVPMSAATSASKSKSRYLWLVLVTAVVILFFSILVVSVLRFSFSKSAMQRSPAISRPENVNLSENVNTSLSIGLVKHAMVLIPGGTFRMGRDDGLPWEGPSHNVAVATFLLDNTEVTNAEYVEFVRDANYQTPSHWLGGQPVSGQEQWPVVNVSYEDAIAFAAWRSKRDRLQYRLPTEEEWEYAARNGIQSELYPWGNTWTEGLAVVKAATPAPVGSYPRGKNRWGVLDLIGNVWEWTSSKASMYDGKREFFKAKALPAARKDWIVARGGSYSSDPNNAQVPVSATYRDWFDPTSKRPNFGFRLARSTQ